MLKSTKPVCCFGKADPASGYPKKNVASDKTAGKGGEGF